MHLIRLLLPLYDNDGNRLPELLDQVFDELTHKFGGVTAYRRFPAEGAWKPQVKASSTTTWCCSRSWSSRWIAHGGPITAACWSNALPRTSCSSYRCQPRHYSFVVS